MKKINSYNGQQNQPILINAKNAIQTYVRIGESNIAKV